MHKNFEIECACQQLEGRLAQLQQLAKERWAGLTLPPVGGAELISLSPQRNRV